MQEIQKDGSIRTIEQEAICENRRTVVDWYGLKEPDIVSYKIEAME